ncbi:glycosyltransferase [Archangium violaceum]|uniref:glycosyltransferase n=1 Tax=Archangium violaceum TaxID=83451 RepID=UPI002B30D3C5|nr:glycosyltransferase [Archangium gephyra]
MKPGGPGVRQADVVIPIYADVALTRACIESVLGHTGEALGTLILVNDRSPDPEMAPMLRELRERHPQVVLLENEQNQGFVGSANRGMAVRTRDVVLLNSDTLVTGGWLTELLDVAYSSDRIAAVVPLSNNATICSVPAFFAETKMEALRGRELRLEELRPRFSELPTGVGFCLLLKDMVLNMLGGLDPVYGRGYNEENDWCLRAQRNGMMVVRANRALVYHLGSVSFGEERNELERRNARILLGRYPHYTRQVGDFSGTLEAQVAAHYVKRRLGRVSVCIDGRHILGVRVNGTGIYAAELVKALAAHTSLELSASVRTEEQRELFQSLGIPLVEGEKLLPGTQVLHRPAQVFQPEEMRFLLEAPAHSVITYQDLISYRASTAHPNYDIYRNYRALSFALLHAAQAVIAISEHNRQEILSEFHLPPERVHVVHHGVDAETFRARDEQGNRRVLESRGIHGPFFLYAGSDHTHKNLRLLVEGYQMFRARWRGQTPPPSLVFMGPCSQVRGALYRETTWPEGVMYLGLLPASEVRVFFQEALAYVYPTTYEGFGLPVLEAMAAGTPVLCSSLTSVPEVAGEAGLYLREFSPEEVSRRLSELATDAGLRRRLVEAGHQQVKRFTWKETARRTEEVYLSAIDGTPEVSLRQKQAFSTLFARSLDAEARARAAEQRVHELEEKLALASLPGFGLVEPLVKAVARRKAKRE